MSRVTTPPRRKRRDRAGSSQRYFMRCPALDVHSWEPFSGPASLLTAVRIKTERMDADAAFPVAIGGKSVTVEVRRDGSAEIMRFKVTGNAVPHYHVLSQEESANREALEEPAGGDAIDPAIQQLRALLELAGDEDGADAKPSEAA
jgi:hypothetical protein